MSRRCDILVVGAGPAGLTAAIYARRAGRVLEKDTFGGQITYSPKLENYPGFAEISGNELAQRMLEQAMQLGAVVILQLVGRKQIIERIAAFRRRKRGT